jgi:hypothetical protein
MPSTYDCCGDAIGGTPNQAGDFTFTVQAKDGAGDIARQAFAIAIAPPLPLQITSGPCCPGGAVGAPYGVTFFSSGGVQPYTWSITSGSLTPGISLCPTPPANLNGLPTTAGTFTFTVRVTDSQGAQASESGGIAVQVSSSTPDSLVLTPACVKGGLSSTGTIRLSHPAPAGGIVVNLAKVWG